MELRTQPYIGGKFVDAASSFAVRNPWDDSTVAWVGMVDRKLLEDALAAAQSAGAELQALKPYQRAELLAAISAKIAERNEELAKLVVSEVGKPITLARGEVQRAVGTFKIASEEARRLEGELHWQEAYSDSGGEYALIRRFPLSPVLAITPFNFPLNLVAHKVAPALAVGSAVLHKPSRSCPLTALALADIYDEAGVAAGALNVVPCPPSELDFLLASDAIKKISFTGSAEVGWALKAACGKKKITLELGGNAAVVIDEVSDLAGVAAAVARAAFAYAGQVCISVQRILVRDELYDDFVRELVAFTENGICTGDPWDEEVLVGPMITRGDVERVGEWVAEAVEKGAKVLTGGESDGPLYQPTLLAEVPTDAKVWREEAFAPLAVLWSYKTFEDAVGMVNDSRFGLQAGYFVRDMDKALYAYNHTEVGAVLINETPIARLDQLPYGGVKDSGFGREGIRAAMEELTEPRMLVLKPGR